MDILRQIPPILFLVWVVSSMLTHILVCSINADWILLIVGLILFPVGCVFGTGIWFGAW